MEQPSIPALIAVSVAFREAIGLAQESTLSHRVFGDTKKIAQLRAGSDITLGRYNAAMGWFATHWPEGVEPPAALAPYRQAQKDVA